MGVHPYAAMLNSSQALAANDTSAAETSTVLGYPVVLSPEENAGSLNNVVFPPTTDQLSPPASESGFVPGLSPYSSQFNSSGQGYYNNVPANVVTGSDHGTYNH